MIGPPIAGFVVARFGEGVCFALNAASFLAVLGSLWAMRVVEPAGSGGGRWPLRELVEGLEYAWGRKAVRVLLVTAGLACLSSSSCFTLAPVFADKILRMGSQGFGLLTGAMGVGAVWGTLILAGRGRARGLDGVLIWCAAGLGLAMVAFAGFAFVLVFDGGDAGDWGLPVRAERVEQHGGADGVGGRVSWPGDGVVFDDGGGDVAGW